MDIISVVREIERGCVRVSERKGRRKFFSQRNNFHRKRDRGKRGREGRVQRREKEREKTEGEGEREREMEEGREGLSSLFFTMQIFPSRERERERERGKARASPPDFRRNGIFFHLERERFPKEERRRRKRKRGNKVRNREENAKRD